MKLLNFFTKKAPAKKTESLLAPDFGEDIFDGIQQEFISKTTANAEKIVRSFNIKYDDAFDYSIRSLNVLDSLIEDFSDFTDHTDKDIIDEFSVQAGSYILEVARRAFGGVYFWEDDSMQPVLKTGLPEFEVSLLTFEKVKNRIVKEHEDSIPYFFKRYSEHIRNAEKGSKVSVA